MTRPRKHKVGDVVTWQARGYDYYGVVVSVRKTRARGIVYYTTVATNAHGAEPNTMWLEQFLAHQLTAITTPAGKRRRNMTAVRMWEQS